MAVLKVMADDSVLESSGSGSDDAVKPLVGLFYEDIQGWKTSWMPMKSRGVIAIVAGRKVIFAANSTAVENAERFINRKG